MRPLVFAAWMLASAPHWIDITVLNGKKILAPARINGHNGSVQIITGTSDSYIDKAFAASIGVQNGSSVEVQLGDLILKDVKVKAVDLRDQNFTIGDALFDRVAVELDFAHHRMTFHDPMTVTKPVGAIEIPLVKGIEARAVPVSVEGEPAARFEVYLGDPAPLTVYQPYYEARKLLDDRRRSIRLGGGLGGVRPQEPVATLRRIEFAGIEFSDVPAVFPSNAVRGDSSSLVSGNIGLEILSRFTLIFDYAHDRLFASPDAAAVRAGFVKDRLGLFFTKHDTDIEIAFVAPRSPAELAGFKAGDRIVAIDSKPVREWLPAQLANLQDGDAGRTVSFTAPDGSVRRVTLAEYF